MKFSSCSRLCWSSRCSSPGRDGLGGRGAAHGNDHQHRQHRVARYRTAAARGEGIELQWVAVGTARRWSTAGTATWTSCWCTTRPRPSFVAEGGVNRRQVMFNDSSSSGPTRTREGARPVGHRGLQEDSPGGRAVRQPGGQVRHSHGGAAPLGRCGDAGAGQGEVVHPDRAGDARDPDDRRGAQGLRVHRPGHLHQVPGRPEGRLGPGDRHRGRRLA